MERTLCPNVLHLPCEKRGLLLFGGYSSYGSVPPFWKKSIQVSESGRSFSLEKHTWQSLATAQAASLIFFPYRPPGLHITVREPVIPPLLEQVELACIHGSNYQQPISRCLGPGWQGPRSTCRTASRKGGITSRGWYVRTPGST